MVVSKKSLQNIKSKEKFDGPRLLTKEMKKKCLNTCKELFEHYEIGGESFLDRIVTGDESWIHHHIPDSKRSSAEWHHKGSPSPKKLRITEFAGKTVKDAFWNIIFLKAKQLIASLEK
ncbi:hypothetical protein LAZ67_10002671 [Cordylochernes scorpioides]|uniref:Uncharacterized protein n=1 Tax=Cordylochernes scorpioides TaxID=51811 RepID=A0ABY6KYI3_9ARAC|nr:hypothetical protein LAZ67_10002671 [Cordylochernes scorpioides]